MKDTHKEKTDRRHHAMFLMTSLTVGGSEWKTVRLAKALAAAGWKLTIGYFNAPHTLCDEISIEIDILFLDRKGKFDFAALRRLANYVSHHKVDVICCINLYPLLYGYLARKLFPSNPFRILAATNETHCIGWKDELKMVLFAPILRRIDMIIFGSAYQKIFWTGQYKLEASGGIYIHNGVDAERFSRSAVESESSKIRAKLGIPENSLVVGSIGRFRKEKQYQTIIRACVELRQKRELDVHCLLVGGGIEEQKLRVLIAKIGCGKYVHLLDAADDVRPYLEAMDIFVLCSISETFSNAALEAMAMELPVVLSRVGGCPEMVNHGVNGFLFDAGDTPELVKYLVLLGTDQGRRLKMGQAGRKYVEQKFRFESMVESYRDLFEKQFCD